MASKHTADGFQSSVKNESAENSTSLLPFASLRAGRKRPAYEANTNGRGYDSFRRDERGRPVFKYRATSGINANLMSPSRATARPRPQALSVPTCIARASNASPASQSSAHHRETSQKPLGLAPLLSSFVETPPANNEQALQLIPNKHADPPSSPTSALANSVPDPTPLFHDDLDMALNIYGSQRHSMKQTEAALDKARNEVRTLERRLAEQRRNIAGAQKLCLVNAKNLSREKLLEFIADKALKENVVDLLVRDPDGREFTKRLVEHIPRDALLRYMSEKVSRGDAKRIVEELVRKEFLVNEVQGKEQVNSAERGQSEEHREEMQLLMDASIFPTAAEEDLRDSEDREANKNRQDDEDDVGLLSWDYGPRDLCHYPCGDTV